MIDVSQALAQVLQRVQVNPPATVPLTAALDGVLADDVFSDIDSPPHDKALVDGYAVVAGDLAGGSAELEVLEEVPAGRLPTTAVRPGTATRIMTGAPLPAGADAVVMVEQARLVAGGRGERVQLSASGLDSGANVLPRAASLRRGERVLGRGHRIRAIEVGLLAEIGRAEVRVVRRPRVAVLATGDELVAATATPAAGQIRNSNGPMLEALATRQGAEVANLGIAGDSREQLRPAIREGLRHDVLVLSGGVSAGVLDLVPPMLAEMGVERVFHKVRLRPGKPLWFGVSSAAGGRCLVFALPGNPVGTLVCFELFVRPALERMGGGGDRQAPGTTAALAEPFLHRGQRATYFPAVCAAAPAGGPATVRLLPWLGSADLRRLADANCLAVFPPGERSYAAGEPVTVMPI